MTTLRSVPASLAAVTAAALLAAGCGSSSSKSTSTSTPAKAAAPAKTTPAASAPSAGATKVTIADFKFKPASITVKAGQKITFTNTDSSNHTATGKGFDTGNLPQHASKTVTFAKKGTFPYVCDYHPFMKGTVVVQ